MPRVACLLLMGLVMTGVAAGEIPDREFAQAPSAQRVAAIQAEAAQVGWAAVAPSLRSAAVRTYERKGAQAQAWYYLYRWADLFGQTGIEAVDRWSDAVRQSRVGYGDGFQGIHPTDRPLGDLVPPDLQAYMMGSPDFSDQFFTTLSPLDQPLMVLHTLAVLWSRNPAEFREYPNLAIAIAVVYDVPPPSIWPHRQVTQRSLPRGLFPPAEIFGFFVKSDRTGALLQPLRKLPASELKYVVDTSANLDELFWAQQKFRLPLAALSKVYEAVPYRRDRLAARIMVWPLASYRLPDILQAGGICVDQAYFAAMVGKAKGVPTLIFEGAGLDGNHAWFGFLDGDGHWQLDCARYLYQEFAVGFAIDPQTWTIISDHELKFLDEGFRRLSLFKMSVVHRQFSEIYLGAGDNASAAKAARAAVSIEPRNLEAWYRLLAAQERMGIPPRQQEQSMQEAALIFQRYADVEADFKRRLAASLRGRGEASAADLLERSIVHEDETARESMSVQQAYDIVQHSMQNDGLDASIKTYYAVLNSFGRGADIVFFHQVVQPFVEYLLRNERPDEAVQAVGRARRIMRVEPRGQLDAEMSALTGRIQSADR
jgi:tetratricopeptide (TPR) repeat protein